MADPNFSWIYILIFMAIPLSRIIPRLLAKRGIGTNFFKSTTAPKQQLGSNFTDHSQKPQMNTLGPPPTKNDLVLDALNRGSKTFESIQKNTGLDSQTLDSILEDLERDGLLKVVHKQGMFGPKTELHPTGK